MCLFSCWMSTCDAVRANLSACDHPAKSMARPSVRWLREDYDDVVCSIPSTCEYRRARVIGPRKAAIASMR